jgi:hypothetical protein
MNQCKIIGICTWRYCNIGHIDAIKFYSTKLWCVHAIPSFVSWFKILSQYGVGIVFLLGFGRAMQYLSWWMQISKNDVGMAFRLHIFVQVKYYTINVKNFALPSFTWINIFGI